MDPNRENRWGSTFYPSLCEEKSKTAKMVKNSPFFAPLFQGKNADPVDPHFGGFSLYIIHNNNYTLARICYIKWGSTGSKRLFCLILRRFPRTPKKSGQGLRGPKTTITITVIAVLSLSAWEKVPRTLKIKWGSTKKMGVHG